MHLRRLAIHALPGIEPGFTFEPADAGINIVTGPNAIGKSSLARALQYVLARHATDPPAERSVAARTGWGRCGFRPRGRAWRGSAAGASAGRGPEV